ncbi:MAG: NADPH:quinone reductase-like Zn-dependent oxidoreductase [Myxococcota bacterium]|jgi:NADPH:quinone reductase-like Zn-dependent oxidoreductase
MRTWTVPAWGALTCTSTPAADPGPGQVRLRMRAASLNYRDLLMWRGQYDRRVLPYVPLSDGCGVVDAVGPDVRSVRVGDRVVATFSPTWHSGPPDRDAVRLTRGGPIDGVLSDAIVLGADEVVAVPDHLSDAEAATLPCAGLTAWSALQLSGVTAGQTVLTLGTGGVSLFAVQLAGVLGARVVATTSSADKADRLRALGAAHVIDYTLVPEWGKAARRYAGDGVHAVVEVGGAGTLQQSLKAVRVGGAVALIGVLDGGQAPVDVLPVLMRQIRIQGVFVGSRDGLVALCQAVEVAQLKPVVDRVFPVAEVDAAFGWFAARKHVGKVCLTW